ncbi:hypothetical protein PROFUN_04048 [Planoprotostelium fungivorum]|uniref:PH domain-containing protein n=1 Tax=Planoprotostelium fungivorum TaxID=1890364 RepID=A0A2P6NW82_9EUKA|nr:hypothetical protein PROFUN_04048 [Planoprotostelium fungivorum]
MDEKKVDPTFACWFEKKGTKPGTKWQKRWFIMEPTGQLSWREQPEDASEKGHINIADLTGLSADSRLGRYSMTNSGFQVEKSKEQKPNSPHYVFNLKHRKKTYHLRTDDLEEGMKWLRYFEYLHNKLTARA